MNQSKQAPGVLIALLAGWLLPACGGPKAKPAAPSPTPRVAGRSRPAPTPKQKIRLAVLPADSDRFPRLAAALTTALAGAVVPGVDDVVVSKASLEVVQISIECIDASAECWTAAGRELEVSRVLFARVSAEADQGGRSSPSSGKAGRASQKPVTATVTLFDVDTGAEVRSASRTWASEDAALGEVAALVTEVAGGAP